MRRSGKFLVFVLSSGVTAAAAPAPGVTPAVEDPFAAAAVLTRETLVAAVLARNPSLAAARAAVTARESAASNAGALEDPRLSYGVAPLSVGSSGVPFGQELRLSQELPFAGKRRWRETVARAEARSLGAELGALQLELTDRAERLFAQYALARRAQEINRQHLELVADFKRIAADRYAAGLAPQQEPLQAEVEEGHLEHRRIELRRMETVAVAAINALVHRPPSAHLPPPEPLAVEPLEAGEAAERIAEALAARPEVQAAESAAASRAAELELARLAFRPDFELMASYNSMWDDSEHRTMLGVGINLPVRRARLRASVAEAEARRVQAEEQAAGLRDEIAAEVEARAAEAEEAHHLIVLYRDRVLPAARDQVRAGTRCLSQRPDGLSRRDRGRARPADGGVGVRRGAPPLWPSGEPSSSGRSAAARRALEAAEGARK